jgi:hypothetical protein
MQKVVLVTGGSSGIGRAISKYLTDQNVKVYGTSRKAGHGDLEDNFELVKMDVTDEASIQSALEYILSKEGRLDVLINNAGLGMAGPLENTSTVEAREIYETNVFGLLSVCRVCIPTLRKSSKGQIINITSIGGMIGLPFRGIYCSSKFAVEGITETLSMELMHSGIVVSLIEPGDFKSNINTTRRIVSNVDKSVYHSMFDQTLSQIIKEVEFARDPALIGRKVYSIIQAKHPKLRYKVATFTQRLSVFLKRVLPGRTFENLIMRHYKLK